MHIVLALITYRSLQSISHQMWLPGFHTGGLTTVVAPWLSIRELPGSTCTHSDFVNHVPSKTKHCQHLRCTGFGGHSLKINTWLPVPIFTHLLPSLRSLKGGQTQERVMTAGLCNWKNYYPECVWGGGASEWAWALAQVSDCEKGSYHTAQADRNLTM